jgi:AcrR family transcriptional regulator
VARPPVAEKPARGRPRDGAVDEAILDATERSLASRGYEAMTVEQVAVAAGVSKPTIYLRYRSKAELVEAMIERLRPPLPSQPGASDGADGTDGTDVSARCELVALIKMQEEWVERHGLRLVAAVLLEEADHPELLERFRERVVVPGREAFQAALRAGIARGELRRGADGDEVVDALTGAYWGRAWTTSSGEARQQWPERVVDALLAGLRAPT